MVQVVRITSSTGQRTLYIREGCILAYRKGTCVVRRLPDHDGRVLVSVDGRDERVALSDLTEA